MTRGFFSKPKLKATARVPAISRCGSCGLSAGCRSPRMEPTGEGRRRVLIVAEAPGREEDKRGVQLVGDSGQRLRRMLRKIGVDLDRDCWKTNAVRCYREGNPKPTASQIEACRPGVFAAIRRYDPDAVVLLGEAAVESVVGAVWRNPGSVGRWVGWRIPCQELNAWLCPTYHPAFLLRSGDPVAELLVESHLEAAFALDGKPWTERPDYGAQVERVKAPGKAARLIRGMVKRGGPVSFDYETDRLKPDHPDARIVCCSVCWRGKRTIAFPWHGEAVEAMQELLGGFKQKAGWNLKFEERWTKRMFGHGVSNWLWDGMLASHCLDNRTGITGLKFQAFARLGLGPYDGEISPYLKGDGGNGPNRIGQCDLDDLLTYCGIDSLIEYRICEMQRKEMGFA